MMKTRFLSILLLLVVCKVNNVQAQWQVIYPPLPDSLNFIGWGISVVDENIVWGNPKINIANTVFPPTSLTNKYYYKTLDGGNTWSWGEIDGVSIEVDNTERRGNTHKCEPCDGPSAALEPPLTGSLPLEITPNPVADQFSVLIAGSPSEAFTLRLYDMSGRVALQARVLGGTQATFDIGGLPAGVYQAEVAGAGRAGWGRVVKE